MLYNKYTLVNKMADYITLLLDDLVDLLDSATFKFGQHSYISWSIMFVQIFRIFIYHKEGLRCDC